MLGSSGTPGVPRISAGRERVGTCRVLHQSGCVADKASQRGRDPPFCTRVVVVGGKPEQHIPTHWVAAECFLMRTQRVVTGKKPSLSTCRAPRPCRWRVQVLAAIKASTATRNYTLTPSVSYRYCIGVRASAPATGPCVRVNLSLLLFAVFQKLISAFRSSVCCTAACMRDMGSVGAQHSGRSSGIGPSCQVSQTQQ